MPENPAMIWNAILSIACGSFVWWMRSLSSQFKSVYEAINEVKRRASDTREDMAKNYVAKHDFERSQGDIIARFDRLEEKLDRILINSQK